MIKASPGKAGLATEEGTTRRFRNVCCKDLPLKGDYLKRKEKVRELLSNSCFQFLKSNGSHAWAAMFVWSWWNGCKAGDWSSIPGPAERQNRTGSRVVTWASHTPFVSTHSGYRYRPVNAGTWRCSRHKKSLELELQTFVSHPAWVQGLQPLQPVFKIHLCCVHLLMHTQVIRLSSRAILLAQYYFIFVLCALVFCLCVCV